MHDRETEVAQGARGEGDGPESSTGENFGTGICYFARDLNIPIFLPGREHALLPAGVKGQFAGRLDNALTAPGCLV